MLPRVLQNIVDEYLVKLPYLEEVEKHDCYNEFGRLHLQEIDKEIERKGSANMHFLRRIKVPADYWKDIKFVELEEFNRRMRELYAAQ